MLKERKDLQPKRKKHRMGRFFVCLLAVLLLSGCAVQMAGSGVVSKTGTTKVILSAGEQSGPANAAQVIDAPTPVGERVSTASYELTKDEQTQGQLGAPERHKTLTENLDENGVWNGSYTLTLDVTGKVLEQKVCNKADVIVVFDTSFSMDTSRLNTARSALQTLARQLYENNTEEDPDTVTMSLIPFSTSVGTVSTGMETMSEFEDALAQLPYRGSGGTNWEAALQAADAVPVREDADPYVIFVSDGNPTFHVTDGGYNDYNPRYGQYGTGMETPTNISRCYEQAKDDARQIVLNGKEFYAVSVFGDISRMQDIVNYAYGGSVDGHYYASQDEQAILAAFSDIVTNIITEYSYTNVLLFDEMSSLASVAETNGTLDFTYYKNGEVWTDAPPAAYDPETGIIWDLSGEGKLAAETTYSISFTVWPDQNALDDITDFLNGTKPYDPEAYPDIILNDDGSFSVYSNAAGGVTYTETETVNGEQTEGPPQTVEYERPVMVGCNAVMRVRKEWADPDPSYRPKDENGNLLPVVLTVLRDGKPFAELTLSEQNGWESEIYIVPGLICSDVSADPINAGHDYTVSEQGIAPGYELIGETIHPMLTDGVLVYGGNGDSILTAVNRLKGSLRIRKQDPEGTPLPQVTFRLTSENGETTELTTDETGTATFADLADGSYTLTEIAAAEGYALPEMSWAVTVENGAVTLTGNPALTGDLIFEDGLWTVIVRNRRIEVLPATGGRGNVYPTMLGIVLMLLAAAVILCREDRDRKYGEQKGKSL